MSMQRTLRQHATLLDDQLAIVDGSRHVSFAELHDRVKRLANGLASAGLRPGDRLAILALTSLEYYEWYFACCQLGLLGVPLNVRLTPGEIGSMLDYTKPRGLIVDARLSDQLDGVLDHPQCPPVVVGFGADHGAEADLEELLRSSTAEDRDDIDPDAPVLIAPTSGTTGTMKGALISQNNTFLGCLGWMGGYRMRSTSRWLQSLPMYFAQGAPGHYLPLVAGTPLYVLPAFAPDLALEVVEREGITHTIWPPAMLYQILDQAPDPSRLRSLEVVSTGGSPFEETKLRAALELFGPRIYPTFGLTEATASATQLRPEDYVDNEGRLIGNRYTSIGRPWPGVFVRVVDERGAWVARDGNEVGEIQLAGVSVSQGYYEMEEDTAATFVDGWVRTGDLATVDADGFVYIVDRRKDIIVSGGINVASLEVEKVIGRHPDVVAVAVIGIPHDRWGEAVHAVVVPKSGADLDAEAVLAWCREHLASFKKPQSVEFVADLPVSSTGKVLKRELRQPYWAGRRTQVS